YGAPELEVALEAPIRSFAMQPEAAGQPLAAFGDMLEPPSEPAAAAEAAAPVAEAPAPEAAFPYLLETVPSAEGSVVSPAAEAPESSFPLQFLDSEKEETEPDS